MSYIRLHHVTHGKESRCAECDALMVAAASSDGRCMSATSPAGVSHDTYRDESCHTLDCVMSHIEKCRGVRNVTP